MSVLLSNPLAKVTCWRYWLSPVKIIPEQGVSGMLLYKDGNFMQLLEGEETVVRNLFEVITQDSRHRGTIVLLEEQISEPSFRDWSMGFRDLADENLNAVAGYTRIMNSPLDASNLKSNPDACLDLLYFFSKSR
jgi:hypothetical protein